MHHKHCVYLGQFGKRPSKIEKKKILSCHPSPSVCVCFMFNSLPVPTLNISIQVEENKSLVKMKMLEYPRKQSWKKVNIFI